VLRRYGRELEADLQRYYGIHIGHLGTRRLTFRRLLVLMNGLPSESSFVAAQAADMPSSSGTPNASEWPLTDQLLVHVIDVLQWANWQRGGGKGRKPTPIATFTRRKVLKPERGVDTRAILDRVGPVDGLDKV